MTGTDTRAWRPFIPDPNPLAHLTHADPRRPTPTLTTLGNSLG
jgi:hypothetical protein